MGVHKRRVTDGEEALKGGHVSQPGKIDNRATASIALVRVSHMLPTRIPTRSKRHPSPGTNTLRRVFVSLPMHLHQLFSLSCRLPKASATPECSNCQLAIS
jgi:hypothetical protein